MALQHRSPYFSSRGIYLVWPEYSGFSSVGVSYRGLDKWTEFRDRKYLFVFWFKFPRLFFPSDNKSALMVRHQQGIIRTSDISVHWQICASSDFNVLNMTNDFRACGMLISTCFARSQIVLWFFITLFPPCLEWVSLCSGYKYSPCYASSKLQQFTMYTRSLLKALISCSCLRHWGGWNQFDFRSPSSPGECKSTGLAYMLRRMCVLRICVFPSGIIFCQHFSKVLHLVVSAILIIQDSKLVMVPPNSVKSWAGRIQITKSIYFWS